MKINVSPSQNRWRFASLVCLVASILGATSLLSSCGLDKVSPEGFDKTSLIFADLETAKTLQVEDDLFKSQASPLARKILAFSETAVTAEALDPALKELARIWTPEEIASQVRYAKDASILAKKAGLHLKLPAKVNMVKNTPELFSGAPYTRGISIFSPRPLKPSELIHELWHIASRANHERLGPLYKLVGYTPCNGQITSIGPDIRDAILTNPDTEIFGDYCVTLNNSQGTPTRYSPLNYGNDPFDGNLNVVLVEIGGDPQDVVVKDSITSKREMFAPETFNAYAKAIGGNGLSEPIHPDEIVAKSIEAKLALVSGSFKPKAPNGPDTNTNLKLLDQVISEVTKL